MSDSWIKNYPIVADLTEADLDENSSLKKMLALIGTDKRVLDFGCATGYFAQLLTQARCTVVGVEINPEAAKIAKQYCQSVIVADLDYIHLKDILPRDKFNVAVFGDVLEHLRDPWRILREVHELLEPDGFVVASIPNIAHGSIRLALLKGYFNYTNLGILDNTHLRFFTRKTVEELFEASGFILDSLDGTTYPVFFDSIDSQPLVPYIDRASISNTIIEEIEQDENSYTLQFVIRAHPDPSPDKHVAVEQYSQEIDQMIAPSDQLKDTQNQLKQAHLRLEEMNSQLEQTQLQAHLKLEEINSQLEQTQAELIDSRSIIQAMKSSKFWKIREFYLKIKRSIGIHL